MKTAKLELNSIEASTLYRGLAAYEEKLRADKDDEQRAAIILSLSAINQLKDKVAVIFEKTRPLKTRKPK